MNSNRINLLCKMFVSYFTINSLNIISILKKITNLNNHIFIATIQEYGHGQKILEKNLVEIWHDL